MMVMDSLIKVLIALRDDKQLRGSFSGVTNNYVINPARADNDATNRILYHGGYLPSLQTTEQPKHVMGLGHLGHFGRGYFKVLHWMRDELSLRMRHTSHMHPITWTKDRSCLTPELLLTMNITI